MYFLARCPPAPILNVKRSEWESVCEAVSAVGTEKCTHAELIKKWSDIKVDVKRRAAAHHQSVAKTEEEELTLFEHRVAWGQFKADK